MHKILYIVPTHYALIAEEKRNKFACLSSELCGHVLSSVPDFETNQIQGKQGIGNFTFHFFPRPESPKLLRSLRDVFFFVRKGLELHKAGAFEVIVAYGPTRTGFAGLVLKWLTKKPFILEIGGVPSKSHILEHPTPTLRDKILQTISNRATAFLVKRVDCVRLFFPDQLKDFPSLRSVPYVWFHDFVPMSLLTPGSEDKKYILFLGHPWFLKGVDVLIKAFQKLSPEFPDYVLKIVGYCPDKSFFQKLALGNRKIELLNSVSHENAIELISAATVFVLPSRTESMGRVLLEAMALKTPIIASRVDGIPHYIEDNKSGLLFESENVDDLYRKMKTIFSDKALLKRISEDSFLNSRTKYTEKVYAEKFSQMVRGSLKSHLK